MHFMPPNGLRYWLVGVDNVREQKKLEARKMSEKLHRTHQSSARFVRLFLEFIPYRLDAATNYYITNVL